MKRMKLFATALVLTALAVFAGTVAAQQTNVSERTFLTFSSAVEMPGLTLQPGTYVFKLADTPSRNVVQVWDRDEKNMLGQWLFVQAERPEVSGETVVTFRETREGATPAVQFWYFPGEKIGKEFIYPRDQAERIAARTGQDVRTEQGVIEGALATAGGAVETAASTVADAAQDVAGAAVGGVQAAADAVIPDPEPAQPQAQARTEPSAPMPQRPVGTSGQAAAAQDQPGQFEQTRRTELPRTASPLALMGLLGALSLAGAAGIRAIRK